MPERELFSQSFDEFTVWLSSFWKANMKEMAYQDNALALTKAGILISLTYEELCTDMPGVLKRICQFIDIESTGFLRTLGNEPITTQNYKWRENLKKNVVLRMEKAMEPLLVQNGYL